MKLMICIWIMLIPPICDAADMWNQIDICRDLKEGEREVTLSVLASQQPYDCCKDTILECLSKTSVCPLVLRLAKDICRRAKAGQTKATIDLALSQRAESAAAPRVSIDISEAIPAGDPDAKIDIVAYVCARCPFCAVFSLDIYKSVTSGRLKGKAKFFVRPYVLRNHSGSTAGAMAMLAAQQLGKFWEMFLYMDENFNRFDAEKLPDWAALNGMDASRFRELMDDSGLRQKLIESQKEGIRNQVNSTPTLFVNNRKYSARLNMEVLEDFVEGEFERLP